MKYVKTFEQFINEKYNHMDEEEEVKRDDAAKEADTRRIGQLLDYKKSDIDKYIKKRY